MFPTQSKVNRTSRIWLLPVVALAMLLVGYAVFAAATAQAQTPAGDVCVEGLVIDWEEKPLAGWVVTLTSDIEGFTPITTVSASAPEADDPDYGDKSKKSKKYDFDYPEVDPDLEKGEFKFSEDDIGEADVIAPTGIVRAGLYTASIELRPGWEGVTPTTIDFPIEVGDDGCARIRFKMRRVVTVTVYKIDADHQPLGDWRIKAIPGPGNLFASPQEEETSDPITSSVAMTSPTTMVSPTVTISGGAAVFTLTPGLWIFTEMAPKQDMDEAQETYVPVVPPNGRQELLIPDDIALDETLTVVFKNELVNGCFIVRKYGVIPVTTAFPTPAELGDEYEIAGWGFKVLRRDGSVARQGITDANGEIRFDNLPLGPYVVVEEDRPGWSETSIGDEAGFYGPVRDIDVQGNYCNDDPEEPVVEFRNEQNESGFCVEGRKIDANGGYGLDNWEITIKPLDAGGFDPDNVFTNGNGDFQIDFPRNDYRIPGAKYEICESEQDGWLPHNATCQTVRLPEWPGACVQLEDFVNQQVGHTESQEKDKGQNNGQNNGPDKGDGKDQGKGGPDGGQSYGGPDGGQNSGPNGGQSHGEGNNAQCSSYHVVKAGEGLYDIGNEYKKSPQQMLDANPSVRDGDKLWVYEGQRICIP